MYGYLFEGMSAGDLGRHRARAMRRRHGWRLFPFPYRRFVQPVWFGPEYVPPPRLNVIPILVRVTDGTGRVREMSGNVPLERLTAALDTANAQIIGTFPARNIIEVFTSAPGGWGGHWQGRKLLTARVYDDTLDAILRMLGLTVSVRW